MLIILPNYPTEARVCKNKTKKQFYKWSSLVHSLSLAAPFPKRERQDGAAADVVLRKCESVFDESEFWRAQLLLRHGQAEFLCNHLLQLCNLLRGRRELQLKELIPIDTPSLELGGEEGMVA